MKRISSRLCLTTQACCSGLVMVMLALGGVLARGPLWPTLQAQVGAAIVQSKPMPAGESPGQRPYEMVRANRRPERAPQAWEFVYEGSDARLGHQVRPTSSGWGSISVKLNGTAVAQALAGAGPVFPMELKTLRLVRSVA